MQKNKPSIHTLHPRNPHQQHYNLELLQKSVPELSRYMQKNPRGVDTIPFADPVAVKLLNKALLYTYYDVQYWDLPEGYLCPPIPGRADYIHYLADLLADNSQEIPHGTSVRILDIGVGANLIYPIIGHATYGWYFVGTDIHSASLEHAHHILIQNPQLISHVALRYQHQTTKYFVNIIAEKEQFDAVICNPPFFKTQEEAIAQTQRKMKNLGQNTEKVIHNFGGKNNELWVAGGELHFVSGMMKESKHFAHQVRWFTSLVSNKNHIKPLKKLAKHLNVSTFKVVEMYQGNKKSRFVAWQF